MLQKVSQDLRQVGDATTTQMDGVMEVLDDVAANLMALQAVVGAMLKKYPVDKADVHAWLTEHVNERGAAEKIETIADFLVTSSK
ncbi:MAG: hypothetical protein HQL41_15690 [Alphaproteobacteria bacterium]|nr:hypothetical protein [Alphaproteobacteria bacterium]